VCQWICCWNRHSDWRQHCLVSNTTLEVSKAGLPIRMRFHSGRIAKLSSSAKSQGSTTLQKEIYRFVLIVCSIALGLVIVVLITWGAWLNKKHKGYITVAVLVIDVVSVAVAMIPGKRKAQRLRQPSIDRIRSSISRGSTG
jgi:magnesium-transporting ATPase (P-type)